jgi:hypothetical protein
MGAAVARGLLLGCSTGMALATIALMVLLFRNPFFVDSIPLSLLILVVLPAALFGVLGLVVGTLLGAIGGRRRARHASSVRRARRTFAAVLIVAVAVSVAGRGIASLSLPTGVKAMLVGVDGATWKVARPMIERGELPNFAAAAKSGAAGVLMSVSPMFSPRIFTTIASGKTADQHGVQGPSDTTTDSVLVKRIWDILWEQNGWDYGTVEWYVTGPPEASPGGFSIPGPPAVLTDTVPADLSFLKEIERATGESQSIGGMVRLALRAASRGATLSTLVELASVGLERFRGEPKLEFYRYEHEAIVKLTTDVTLWQLRRSNVEFLSILYRSTDRLSHSYWRYHEPDAFADTDPQELEEFGGTVEDIYAAVDEQIVRLRRTLAPGGLMVIVSDHGFRPYLTVRAEPFSFKTETLLRAIGIDSSDLTYVNLGYGFYLQPVTIDEQANAERRAELTRILSSLRIEGTDTPAFRVDDVDKAGTGDDYVEVDAAKRLLELIPEDPTIVAPDGTKILTSKVFQASEWSGAHDYDGLIIATGGPFERGASVTDADIYDVTPTILAALGLPVASDMEGRPLVEVMDSDFLASSPVTAIASYETGTADKKAHNNMESMSEELKNQLRAVGYLQ